MDDFAFREDEPPAAPWLSHPASICIASSLSPLKLENVSKLTNNLSIPVQHATHQNHTFRQGKLGVRRRPLCCPRPVNA
jgi:hypothetical protein